MTQFTRAVDVEAGSKEGEFRITSATEGEASDGHILDIDGGEIPQEMRLLAGHENNARTALGLVVAPFKDLTASPRTLENTARILMTGDGADADIRRDMAHKIANGVVNAVSIRWDDIESVARIDLPEDHKFRVDRSDKTNARHGRLFKKWRAIEVSVVAVGADAGALIEHAGRCEDPVQAQFWRSFALEASGDLSIVDEGGEEISDSAAPGEIGHAEGIRDATQDELLSRVEYLEESVDALLERGHARQLIEPEPDLEPEQRADLPVDGEADQQPTERGVTAEDLVPLFRQLRDQQREDSERLLSRATGKVSNE